MNYTINQDEICKLLFSQNITNEFPVYETIYKHVKPIVSFLQDALDYGHLEASTYLNRNKRGKKKEKRKKIDPWLYSVILRAKVREYLKDKNLDIIYDEETDSKLQWNRREEPNLGLSGKFDGREYRILKGRGGFLPSVGLSSKRKEFYRQKHMLQPFLVQDGHKTNLLYNVVFLWDINQNNFVNLYLSCPKNWEANIAFDYFTELLPHSATTIIPKQQSEEFFEEATDIVIERRSELQRRLL